MHELQGIQTLFNRVERQLENTYYNAKIGYKERLRLLMGIDDTAFEVLYYEELEQYLENPQDFHIYNDDSRVHWIEVWEHLNTIEQDLKGYKLEIITPMQ